MSEQQQDPGADPEAERVESLDHRFGAIETKQAEQDGKLDQILSRLTGGAGGGTKAPPPTPVPSPTRSVKPSKRSAPSRQPKRRKTSTPRTTPPSPRCANSSPATAPPPDGAENSSAPCTAVTGESHLR